MSSSRWQACYGRTWSRGPLDYAAFNVDRLRHLIWNGYAEEARRTLPDIMQMAANAVVLNGRQGRARIERFARLVRELETYLGLNTSALVDYGRRYRAGLPISTSRAESTVNSLVNMRMNKRADALVATRRSPRAAGPRCCGRRPALGRSASSDRLIIPTFVPLPRFVLIPGQRIQGRDTGRSLPRRSSWGCPGM
jgi:hypothetical protein